MRLANGSNGYVNSKLIQPAPTAQPQPAAPPDTLPASTPADNTRTALSPPAVAAPVVDEGTRLHQIITSTNFYHDTSPIWVSFGPIADAPGGRELR